MSHTQALLNELAGQLEGMAATLRRYGHEAPVSAPASASPSEPPEDAIARARQLHPALGERQEQVLAEVVKAHPHGTTTGEIWRTIDYEQANTHLTLEALARHGLVRKDNSTRPHTYYLGPRMLQA